MKKFIKYSILFSLPFIIHIASYIIFDPFRVVWTHYNYYKEWNGAGINRSYVSTMNYINKKDKYHYDSFIFGNSRSLFYFINDWKIYIGNNSNCYHFDESGGSINGIYYKIKYIDNCNENIKNALLVIDYTLLDKLEQDGRLFITPPVLANYNNFYKFHYEHFEQWMSLKFVLYWFDYYITHNYKDYMKDYLEEGKNYKYYNPITNEKPNYIQDCLIQDGTYYDKIFFDDLKKYPSHPSIRTSVLNNNKKINSLKDIKKIFNNHNTNYKIVISPLYDQVRLNPRDYNILCDIFGKDNVYDYSGTNDITIDYHNYYEHSHYLPKVANQIMKEIYKKH